MKTPFRLRAIPASQWFSIVALLAFVSACSTPPHIQSTSSNKATVGTPPPIVKVPPKAAPALTAPVLSSEAELKPLDPLRPEIDVQTEANPRADLWSRVRRGFSMPDLNNELVRGREQWYAMRPDYVERMTLRGSRYLFHIVEEVERRNMPTELALLPFIESAFNPQALSSAKASGMWQFMPATGNDYDLRQTVFRDDRRNVLASTRAALDYLQRLHNMFGDWQLALAAYNWGEGSVQRAIKSNQKAGLPTDYSSLRMPIETQYYVPKLQAVKNIIARPESFGLQLPPVENHPYFLAVPIERDIDIEIAARLAQMSLSEFKALNPQMNKPVILAAVTPQILLPYDNAQLYVRNASLHKGPMATWTAWVAARAIRPAEVAKQLRISEAELREINQIPPHMVIKAGSTLVVPRHAHNAFTDVTSRVAERAMIALAPEARPERKIVLRVKRKETLASIARRHGVLPAQVAAWNHLKADSPLKMGQALVVYVPRSRASAYRVARRKIAPHQAKAQTDAKHLDQPQGRSRVASTLK